MLDFNNRKITFLVGVFTIGVLLLLIFNNNPRYNNYNTYYAVVSDGYGVVENQDVSIGGYTVGFVNSISLHDNNQVVLELKINKDIDIASDSIVSLNSSSLTAVTKDINIVMGIDSDVLENGDTIYNTVVGLNFNQFLGLMSNYIKGIKNNEK